MNRLVILRPLASAAVLAVAAMGVAPAFAALSQPGSLSRVAPPALPAHLNGTLITLHPAQRGGDIAVTNGNFYSVRFTSLAQEQRLRVGSRLAVSGDARDQVHVLVRALRTQGISTRAHLRGVVARRLGRGTVELLGMNGAAMVLNLGHVRVTRVYHRAGPFGPALASADDGPTIAPGDEIDTPVALTGAGAVATGTATVAAPSSVQVEVEGYITAVDRAAGTITVQDDDGGPATVVALGAVRGTFYVWQKVEAYGTVTSAGSNGATVQAQFIRFKDPDGYAAAPGATIKVKGRITAVNAAAGTITVQDDDRPPTVVALGAARGTFYVWQKVEVYGTVTSAGSNGATVQAQFIRLDS